LWFLNINKANYERQEIFLLNNEKTMEPLIWMCKTFCFNGIADQWNEIEGTDFHEDDLKYVEYVGWNKMGSRINGAFFHGCRIYFYINPQRDSLVVNF